MALLRESDKRTLEAKFGNELSGQVTIHTFKKPVSRLILPGAPEPAEEMQLNQLNTDLANAVAELSDKLTVKHHEGRNGEASNFGLSRFPAIVLESETTKGAVRWIGVPYGTEFSAFVDDIINMSRGQTRLSAATIAELEALDQPVHIQVFSTPTCPWCPRAASLAHQMAMVSEQVTADAIDVNEFPDMAQRYSIRGVPKVVINERISFEGALPEEQFLDHVLAAVTDAE